MEILAEASETVQIVTLITGTVTAICLPFITYLTVRQNAKMESAKTKAEEAAVKVEQVRVTTEQAAVKVEEVRKTLVDTKADTDDKLEGLAEIGAATHTLVNSAMGAQLRLSAETSRFKADTIARDRSKSKAEVEIAEAAAVLAEKTLADHTMKQHAVDVRVAKNDEIKSHKHEAYE